MARRYDEAVLELQGAMEVEPGHGGTHEYLGFVYFQQQLYAQAEREINQFRSLEPENNEGIIGLGSILAKSAEAKKLLTDLEFRSKQAYISPVFLAWLPTALGQKEKAIQLLQRGFDEHDTKLPYLKVEPIFDPLK